MSRLAGSRAHLKVLVTDAHVPTAVAAARSLGGAGHEVHVACPRGAFPLAALSRHARGLVRTPDPAAAPDAFAASIVRELRRAGFDALLPLADATYEACAPAIDEIRSLSVWCGSSPDAVRASNDKWALLELGSRCGLAVPSAWLVRNEEDWRRASREAPRGIVLRARRSVRRVGGEIVKPRVGLHFDRASADRDARRRLDAGEEFVASAFFAGHGRGVYVFLAGGKPALSFGHIRVREANPCGAPACAARALAPEPELLRRCVSMLASLGVEGAAMVEFRRDDATGVDRLVEVNPRLWGSVFLAIAAGIDFPAAQIGWFAFGRAPRMPDRPAAPAGARYLTGELTHLAHALRGRPEGWEGDFPTAREAWRGMAESTRLGYSWYLQSADDPLPGLAEPVSLAMSWLGALGARG